MNPNLKSRNRAVLYALIFLIVMIYAVTMIKMAINTPVAS